MPTSSDIAGTCRVQADRVCDICCKAFSRPEHKREHDARKARREKATLGKAIHPDTGECIIEYHSVLSDRRLSG